VRHRKFLRTAPREPVELLPARHQATGFQPGESRESGAVA
jgi:hypothetical protein